MAGTIVVTDFDDLIDDNDGTCTLREAIRSANGDTAIDGCSISLAAGDDRILLTAGTYRVDLAGGSQEDASLDGDLDIDSSMEIRGISPEYTIIDGDADSSQERVFDIGPNPKVIDVTLRDLTVTGGREAAGDGGNIRSQGGSFGMGGGSIALRNVTISDGGAVRGGGVYVSGGLEVWRATVRDNEALGDDGVGGGIALAGGALVVQESGIENNQASIGGGLYSSGEQCVVYDSQIRNNVAMGGSGLQSGRGGGIASTVGAINVNRTLIESNEASSGAGLWLGAEGDQVVRSAIVGNTATADGGGVLSTNEGFVRHSTIAGNEAASGGGVYADTPAFLLDAVTLAGNTGGGLFNETGTSVEASVFADNAGGNCLGGDPIAGAYNLEDADTCAFPTNDPNRPSMVNTDPLLGPLQDNGDGLPTMALLSGSPAIDAVSSDVRMNCQKVSDQRGYPRGYPPILSGDPNVDDEYLCDIGAFEVHPPYIVDSTADTVDDDVLDGICADAAGACTLRAAIMQANAVPGLEEIELSAETYAITLPGADEDDSLTGDLDIVDFVVIRGQGADQTIIDAARLDRALDFPPVIKEFGPGYFSTIADLSLQQGAWDFGGAIRVSQRLLLQRAVLSDNTASGDGGAIFCGAGCELQVVDSTVRANTAPAGFGGAIYHEGLNALRLVRSTLSGNSASYSGAMEVTSTLRALNTTISGNSADESSGAFVATRAILESSTVFDNQAVDDTGAIFVFEPSVLSNSIVADNRIDSEIDNCGSIDGTLVSAGFNLSDTDAADCNLTETTDVTETDPLLEPLADNDGLTSTHALRAESPAIDAGSDGERCPAMDQRGIARPADGDGDGTATCDIGAFEFEPEPEADPDPPAPPPSGGGGNGGGGGAVGWPALLILLVLCRRLWYRLFLAALMFNVAACGGGGGGGGRNDGSGNPPSPPSSAWDEMNWDDGQWG